MDESLRESLEQQWRAGHSGDKRGGTAILSGGLDYKRIGLGLEELAFDSLHGVSEARICSAFMVPPEVVELTLGADAGAGG